MGRPATKTPIALQIMHDNADKRMADVLPIIMEKLELKTLNQARTYYKKMVEEHGAPGVVEKQRMGRPPKADKAVKAVKEPKAVSVPTVTVARAGNSNATEKTADEIAAIRAANLEKIREVHQRMIANGQLPNTTKRVIEVDEDEPEFKTSVDQEMEQETDFPSYLTKDQLDHIL